MQGDRGLASPVGDGMDVAGLPRAEETGLEPPLDARLAYSKLMLEHGPCSAVRATLEAAWS